ncbi:hypothetical protein SDC9_124341 [bioreactor metagenome]|uniref:Uncharacterized protein n=1 Tax=bioreactor metagenome TaxID=1076179 RepID=A0A645CKA7_9ZZZZ
MGLFLRKRCNEGQAHFTIVIEGIEVFRFKEYADRGLEGRQSPHIADTVIYIAGEARNAFGNNEIN